MESYLYRPVSGLQSCLRGAATPPPDVVAVEPRRSTSCADSHRTRSHVSYRSPPSNKSAPVQLEQGLVRGGSAGSESTWGEASLTLAAPPEEAWEDNSGLQHGNSLFPLLQQYQSGEWTAGSPLRQPPLDACVLTPRIIVTPEHHAVDEDTTAVWAAVQVSTQVCRADAPGFQHNPALADISSSSGEQNSEARKHSTAVPDILKMYPGMAFLMMCRLRSCPPPKAPSWRF